jgi:hypothetical protein
MKINLPLMLEAEWRSNYDYVTHEDQGTVVIKWGIYEVVELTPIRQPDRYIDSYDDEVNDICAETAAAWLKEKLT